MREVSKFKSSPRRSGTRQRALILLALCALACRDEPRKPKSQRADSIASSPTPPVTPRLLTPAGLARALSAFKERAGKAPDMLMLEFAPDRTTFQARASDEPRTLVEFEWREDQLAGPFPVEVRGNGVLEQNLFSLSALDWNGISELLSVARNQVDLDNGRVTRLLVRRNLPQDDAVLVRVYVESPVRSGHIDADARGRLLDPPR